jgi:Holliday junction resolvasome RuvABC endonuclease subunit
MREVEGRVSILALDLSLTATGWATSIDEYGVWRSGDLRGTDRLINLAGWLHDTLLETEPELVVIEGYSYGSKGRAVFDIAEWGGVARYILSDNWHEFAVIRPATLKKFATGKGNSPKPTMRMELYKRAGIDVSDDNAVDALWLLAAAMEATGKPLFPMPKANVEALDKVEWPGVDVRIERMR